MKRLSPNLFSVAVCLVIASGASARGVPGTRELLPDPDGVIDLPSGFRYTIVSRAGDEMSDGFRVPTLPDGMGAFRGPDGTTIVVCNHEGAFESDMEWLARVDSTKLFDRGHGGTPPSGGTTTFVWDTRSGTLVRRFLSLAGTIFNCSGGTTPWNTWLTCEEKTYRAGWSDGKDGRLGRDHGWVFEVPATAGSGLAAATPLVAMGRFTHEAVVYDERTGVIYQTEDVPDGLFYRFLPAVRGDLGAGGRLQALVLRNHWRESNNRVQGAPRIEAGRELEVKWIDMNRVDAPGDSLRYEGYDRGACRFDRGEGICIMEGVVYFTSTSGGALGAGQIWRYTPAWREARKAESRSPGTMELYYEVEDTASMQNPDNICPTPAGELLVCEDPESGALARLVVLTGGRDVYTFAKARVPGEFTGAVFSPDESTLFVNLQKAGLTLAITGPWNE